MVQMQYLIVHEERNIMLTEIFDSVHLQFSHGVRRKQVYVIDNSWCSQLRSIQNQIHDEYFMSLMSSIAREEHNPAFMPCNIVEEELVEDPSVLISRVVLEHHRHIHIPSFEMLALTFALISYSSSICDLHGTPWDVLFTTHSAIYFFL